MEALRGKAQALLELQPQPPAAAPDGQARLPSAPYLLPARRLMLHQHAPDSSVLPTKGMNVSF